MRGVFNLAKMGFEKISRMEIHSLVTEGKKRLSWAESNMPVLASIRQRFENEKPLQGTNIGVALHLEKKTGILLRTLVAGGAQLSAASCNPLTTDDSIAGALAEEMDVFAWANQTEAEYYNCLESVIASKPQITIDDGCDLIYLLHTKHAEALDNVIGGCEETTTGILRLEAMHSDGVLKVPVMAVNNAHSKYLFDNRYGTGQSVIEGILSATNTLIAGKTVVVVGYGWCGRGIANRLKGLGAKVIVVESATTNKGSSSGYHRALEASYDGCWVMSMKDAASHGDIFITATGNKHVISGEHFSQMKDGAVLANSGHFNHEIDLDALESKSESKETILTNVEKYAMKNGKNIILLAQGRLVNLAQPTGQGHPIEIMDGSFGVQALCVEYLAKRGDDLKSGVYNVPIEIDNDVARIALESQGIILDKPTDEQEKYTKTWKEGT